MDGGAGPSGVDAAGWRRLCTAFKKSSADLCDAIALLARRLGTSYLDPSGIQAFVACRLVALDKCPGVRPIGIGEVLRRIVGKAVLSILKEEIMEATGVLQLCAGQEAGCEVAVHALREVFNSSDSEAILLVDASNAFNSLNRKMALRNIRHLCPSLATILINTYRSDINLFIENDTTFSSEGVTQGDPLAMAMYAISTIPLIRSLKTDTVTQVWYANDASAGGSLLKLRHWWDKLTSFGPDFGYLPNASKSWLVVKEGLLPEASDIFSGTSLNITDFGRRFLGAAIESPNFVESFVMKKVSSWVHIISELSTYANSQPHAAYSAFTKGLFSKWNFLTRTIPSISHLLQPLEEVISQKFIPSVTGRCALNRDERDLLSLPARMGGLVVQMELSPLFVTMKSETFLLMFLLRSALEWVLSQFYSPFLVNLYVIIPLIPRIMLD